MLKDEQKYAAGSYRKDEELLEDPPNDFELDNPPGKRCLYVLKEHKDEQLIVELDLEEQVDAADDMDEGRQWTAQTGRQAPLGAAALTAARTRRGAHGGH